MTTRQTRVRGAIIATTAATALGIGMIVFAAQSSAETTTAAPIKLLTTPAPTVGQPLKFSVYGQDYGKAMVAWPEPVVPAGVTFTGFRLWVVSDDPEGQPPTVTPPPTITPPPPNAPKAAAVPSPPPYFPPKPVVVRTLPADARVSVVTGLSPRFNYTFHLVATSAQGETPDASTGLRRATVKLSATPATVVHGSPVTLTVQLVRAGDGPKAGESVLVERRASGTPDWFKVAEARTGANLKWTGVTRPATTTAYRTYFTGSKGLWPAVEATAVVTVRYQVSVKASTTKPKPGQKITVSGAVRPIKAGTKVNLQRKSGSSWVTIATSTIKANGTYAIPKSFAKGSWPLRVVATGGPTLAYGWSSQVTVTAK